MEKKREGGVSIFSVGNFLSQSAKNFSRGIIQSVINLAYRKDLCFRGLYNDYSTKFFCITVPKFS